jgi:hypothetical protein
MMKVVVDVWRVWVKAAGGGSERFVHREVEPAKEMLRRRTYVGRWKG